MSNMERGGRPCVVPVLGVHRSGTSLLTAGLEAIGCELGTIIPRASEENPRGFFEHAGMRAFNDDLLERRLGVSWDNWGFVAGEHGLDGPDFAPDRAAALAMLAADLPSAFGPPALDPSALDPSALDPSAPDPSADGTGTASPRPIALKDPRVSTLLPFWEAVLAEAGVEVRRILLVRDPDEVARSQATRARRSPEAYPLVPDEAAMHALWCVTMRTVLSSLPDDRTLLVRHADLYDRTEATLRGCADFIGIVPSEERLGAYLADFVDRDLRRSTGGGGGGGVGADDARDPWRRTARGLFDALAALGSPARLGRDEARAVLDAQTDLSRLVAALGPVRSSLAGARMAARRPRGAQDGRARDGRARDAALVRSLNVYAALAIAHAPADALAGRVETLTELAGSGAYPNVLVPRLAQAMERSGDHEGAERLYRQVRDRAPFAAVRLVALLRSQGRIEEAERERREAHARFPDKASLAPDASLAPAASTG